MTLGGGFTLMVACGIGLGAGIACGGMTDHDTSTGGGPGTGIGGSPSMPADCKLLDEDACLGASHCSTLLRNDVLIPNTAPPPAGKDFNDPCCIGCQEASCASCPCPALHFVSPRERLRQDRARGRTTSRRPPLGLVRKASPAGQAGERTGDTQLKRLRAPP